MASFVLTSSDDSKEAKMNENKKNSQMIGSQNKVMISFAAYVFERDFFPTP